MAVYPSADIRRQAACADSARPCEAPRARIAAVEPLSPADDAGFTPGCFLTSVDGHPLRDLIDWRWLSAEDTVTVGYIDADGEAGECELMREEGESWGFSFDGVVFDRVRQCRNACTFCFMRQLPAGARSSLTLRDDDFRLSFLCGTFVTFTNLTAEDEERIVDQALSPLRFSLHASDPDLRRRLIGRHAQHGLDALERLLARGVQVHAQIVLVPGVNDGAELRRTLEWAYARPGILDVCVVPLGYTRHQRAFDRSFDAPDDARAVLDELEPFQRRALSERGGAWVFAADEFYLSAFGTDVLDHLPPASFYGGFEMFEDGVGIVRTCVDDWRRGCGEGLAQACGRELRRAGATAAFVCGRAMERYFPRLIDEAGLAGAVEPLFVDNRHFGGNVNVTGLLSAADVVDAVRALPAPAGRRIVAVPSVLFNDQGLTLDGATLDDMEKAFGAERGKPVVVSCLPTEFFRQTIALARSAQSRVPDETR